VSPRIFQQRGSNWVKIATGDNHSLGIKSDGSLWAWGRNDFGQMGIGRYDSLLSPAGMPIMRPQPVRVGLETNWAAVGGGVLFSVALKTDGTLWTWGGNWAGQLGDGASHSLCPLFSNSIMRSSAPKQTLLFALAVMQIGWPLRADPSMCWP
jgi:alpha-tubulin suppressor-like RCC1 family protein